LNLRKAVGPALAALLLVGVGFAVNRSVREKKLTDAAARSAAAHITVKVLSGSEKEKLAQGWCQERVRRRR
jgi:hypothetical protein